MIFEGNILNFSLVKIDYNLKHIFSQAKSVSLNQSNWEIKTIVNHTQYLEIC